MNVNFKEVAPKIMTSRDKCKFVGPDGGKELLYREGWQLFFRLKQLSLSFLWLKRVSCQI